MAINNKNLINTNVGNYGTQSSYSTQTPNYNFFTRKPEEFDLPKIDLEFNDAFHVQNSTFSRTA